jgi:hypothetical protein
VLVDPDFLLRVHRDPPSLDAGLGASARQVQPSAYRLTDLELASRLSFFLWNSIPDERLIDAAERGNCRSRRFSSSRCGACWPTPVRRVRSSTTLRLIFSTPALLPFG